jgi:RNA polymerase-binding transcription factor DksA
MYEREETMVKKRTNLKQMRDELKVRTHLFDSEMKEQWKKFEKDWDLVRSEIKKITPQAKRALTRSALAARPLLTRINQSLERIQEGFERHHKGKR